MDATHAARNARAALALSALLFASQLPRDPRPAISCEEPRELSGRGGHTREVACSDRARGLPVLRGPARRLFGLPLDLNRADAASLESLPGIGPARARAILAERQKRPFATPADLVRVRGIGPRTAAGLASWVAVEPLQENR